MEAGFRGLFTLTGCTKGLVGTKCVSGEGLKRGERYTGTEKCEYEGNLLLYEKNEKSICLMFILFLSINTFIII